MGASNSTVLSPEQREAFAAFTESEIQQFRRAFSAAAKAQRLELEGFKELLGLHSFPDDLAAKAFKFMHEDNTSVTLPDVVVLKHKLEASPSEQAATLWVLLDKQSLEKDLARWVVALVSLTGSPPPSDAFLAPVCAHIAQSSHDLPSFQKALKAWPGLLDLTSALTAAFPSGRRPTPTQPRVKLKAPMSEAKLPSLLLGPDWQGLLASLLPRQQRDEWELLFNSDVHGKSFSSLLGRISGRGPCILVVRDKQGAVFGGYAAEPWEKRGTFYGAPTSFLFRLAPTFSVHFASGVNSNYQWCGHQFKEVPNGIGFGGQSGYFSLLVHDDIDTGMSRPAATYDSPCLASSQVFGIDMVECWLVEDINAGEQENAHGTAIDRFQEDNAILQLHGKVNVSDGYRADRPVDEE